MKNPLLLTFALLFTLFSFAQQGINYKAVIKDSNGNVVASQPIDVKFSIIENTGTTVVYAEDHTNVMTDASGLIVLNIGEGTPTTNTFAGIAWGSDTHSLKTEIDIEQDATFELMGTTQFKTVPYALSSADNLWQLNGNNAIATTEKVGIGTTTPTELLHIRNPNNASIKLETPQYSDFSSSIKLENGDIEGYHTFFKIENIGDQLSIAVDSDLNVAETGYIEKLNITHTGTLNTEGSINSNRFISAQNGVSINEFSTDGTLAGNSDDAVPTEAAVKEYVDNALAAAGPLAYGSIGSDGTIYSGSGNFSAYWYPINQRYLITIIGETYNLNDYTTVVTPSTNSERRASTYDSNDKLAVYIYDTAGAKVQASFHFIIYK